MSELRVIAFDPGELTGWARGVLHVGVDIAGTPASQLEVEAFGYDPWKPTALAFWRTMAEDPYDVVIYETWRLRRSSALDLIGSDMQSSQFIGCVKLATWVAQKERPVRILGQEPSIKHVIDGWKGGTDYLPRDSEGKEHFRDALRHLWYRACKPTDDVDPGYGVRP
jgi:hypothetical protein